MLEPNKVLQEMKALQKHFREKRDYVLRRLKEIGFKINLVPDSTFYIWLDLRDMPEEINDGLNFFQKCLEEKVIGKCMRVSQSIIHRRVCDLGLTHMCSCTWHILRPQSCEETRPV